LRHVAPLCRNLRLTTESLLQEHSDKLLRLILSHLTAGLTVFKLRGAKVHLKTAKHQRDDGSPEWLYSLCAPAVITFLIMVKFMLSTSGSSGRGLDLVSSGGASDPPPTLCFVQPGSLF
jgi:hypothetical protein